MLPVLRQSKCSVVFLALVAAGLPQADAQQASRPAGDYATLAQELSRREREWKRLWSTCENCEGRGYFRGEKDLCRRCNGTKRSIPAAKFGALLDGYLATCDFADAIVAAEGSRPAGVKRATALRDQYLDALAPQLGSEDRRLPSYGPGGDIARVETERIVGPYDLASREAAHRWKSATGVALAFHGMVVREVQADGETLVEVLIGDRAHVDGEFVGGEDYDAPRVLVVVPTGARWVRGDQVRIIGRAIGQHMEGAAGWLRVAAYHGSERR